MSSHLRWTSFTGIGAFALLATCLAAGSGTSQNLVINGNFENGNTGTCLGGDSDCDTVNGIRLLLLGSRGRSR